MEQLSLASIDIGDLCVWCGRSTAPGSGLWVNRVPAGSDATQIQDWCGIVPDDPFITVEGWGCRDCMARPCDRCDHMIPMDEDVYAPNRDNCHYDCLTSPEQEWYENHDDSSWEGFGKHIGCKHEAWTVYQSQANHWRQCNTCELFEDVI